MKKIIALLMALVVISTTALASINISLDGQVLNVPEEMGKPFAQDNRTYVPIRFMLEYFGYDVTYFPSDKQVIGTDSNGNFIMMQVGNPLLFFKNAKVTMDVTPIVDYSIGRIYIPASFLIKEMGYGVDYDKATKTVVITTKTDSAPAEEVTEEVTEEAAEETTEATEEVAEEVTEEPAETPAE